MVTRFASTSLLLLGFLAAVGDEPAKPKGKFTIGKATSYVTGPLDKDGYIDYAAALDERLRHGVTPETNAAVWRIEESNRDAEVTRLG